MRLAKITSSIAVNPEYVASVTANYSVDSVTVRMHDGQEYHLGKEYGNSCGDTYAKIMKVIEEATRP